MRISEITANHIVRLRTFQVDWSMKGTRKGGGSFKVEAIGETEAKRRAKSILDDRYTRHDPAGPWGKHWQITSITDTGQEHEVTSPKAVTAKQPVAKPSSIKQAIRDLRLQYDADEG